MTPGIRALCPVSREQESKCPVSAQLGGMRGRPWAATMPNEVGFAGGRRLNPFIGTKSAKFREKWARILTRLARFCMGFGEMIVTFLGCPH